MTGGVISSGGSHLCLGTDDWGSQSYQCPGVILYQVTSDRESLVSGVTCDYDTGRDLTVSCMSGAPAFPQFVQNNILLFI